MRRRKRIRDGLGVVWGGVCKHRERGEGRETERERGREREREEGGRQTDRQTDRGEGRRAGRQTGRTTEREGGGGREGVRSKQGQILEREREREREREKRERERERKSRDETFLFFGRQGISTIRNKPKDMAVRETDERMGVAVPL